MFNLFKRAGATPAKAPAKTATTGAKRQGPTPGRRAPPAPPDEPSLPEVVEGNEPTDWALWEDSMNVLDSQMQELTPSARIYERDKPTPSELQDLDPFSRVNKKSG